MAHGYLGDGYGSHGEVDPDREDDRERRWRDREWRGQQEGRSDRDRGSMFGDWERDRWSEQRGNSYNRQAEDWSGQHRHSAHPDDHYRSWRDRHMSELDRDYSDYCREREQQFHRDFDTWRQNRQGRSTSGSSETMGEADELQLTSERAITEGTSPDPVDEATLGTNNSENIATGRGSRAR